MRSAVIEGGPSITAVFLSPFALILQRMAS
jgi:hypothetical protein